MTVENHDSADKRDESGAVVIVANSSSSLAALILARRAENDTKDRTGQGDTEDTEEEKSPEV